MIKFFKKTIISYVIIGAFFCNIAYSKCISDKKLIIESLIELSNSNTWYFGEKKIPSGINIISDKKQFVVIKPVEVRMFPSFKSSGVYGLRPDFRGDAECKVEDGNGHIWYVLTTKDKFLSYVDSDSLSNN